MNKPSFSTDPSGYRCSVVSFLLPSASSSPLLLASSVVFVRFLSLRSSPLPSLSHVSIPCCASLVLRLFRSSVVLLSLRSLPPYHLVSTVLCPHVLSVVFSIFAAFRLYMHTHRICMECCIQCSSFCRPVEFLRLM